jgi:hypothetical protein
LNSRKIYRSLFVVTLSDLRVSKTNLKCGRCYTV